jgi:hypothetical protein
MQGRPSSEPRRLRARATEDDTATRDCGKKTTWTAGSWSIFGRGKPRYAGGLATGMEAPGMLR